jgi:hypothetical protein
LGTAGAEDIGGLREKAQQLPDPHRPDAVNHIQSDERFPGIHAGVDRFFPRSASFKESNAAFWIG